MVIETSKPVQDTAGPSGGSTAAATGGWVILSLGSALSFLGRRVALQGGTG